MREIFALIGKDLTLELRQGYALSGLIVYVLATVFIVYISFIDIEPGTWNILYWVIFLFVAMHAVLKSFVQESADRYLYYFTLVRPEKLLIAKILYNCMLLIGLGVLLFLGLSIVTGFPVEDNLIFILAIIFGGVAIGLTFTVISAIAIKADNSATLMAILAFPVIIPVLLNLIRLSSVAMGIAMDEGIWTEVLTLTAIDLLALGMGILLFPLLWKS